MKEETDRKITERLLEMLIGGNMEEQIRSDVENIKLSLIASAEATAESIIRKKFIKTAAYNEEVYGLFVEGLEVLFNAHTDVRADIIELEANSSFIRLSFNNRLGKNVIEPMKTGFYQKQILHVACDTMHSFITESNEKGFGDNLERAITANGQIAQNLIDYFLILANTYSEKLSAEFDNEGETK